MTKENCLAEVFVRFFKAGEPYWTDHLGNYLWETEPQVLPIKQATDKEAAFWAKFQTPQDIYFEVDNCSFLFQSFGQGVSEEWSNPFDWLVDAIGIDEIFQDFLPALKKLAMAVLGEANQQRANRMRPEPPSNCVNFVTAWQYHSFTVEPAGWLEDWEEEWELLGLVNLYDISKILVKEDKCG